MEASSQLDLVSTIALTSTRDDPAAAPNDAAEIYLVNAGGTDPRRLTNNASGDGFPVLSPDGKKIAFVSSRLRTETEPANTSDLFLMNADGTEQAFLIRGSSPTWSPDGKRLAFHRSASGTGLPVNTFPGAATTDSDIFVANVDDLLAGVEAPRNLTNTPDAIDDDPDWSHDGGRIVFTRHLVADGDDPTIPGIDYPKAEIYSMSADGTDVRRLTFNEEEERGPAWSPDGMQIVFACRRGGPDFELCVMNADGAGQAQLTSNAVGDLTPTWSPDGTQIVFHKNVTVAGAAGNQLFVINADGTPDANGDGYPDPVQLTFPPGQNLLASWGALRVRAP